MKILSDRMRMLREEKNLKQEEAASALGLSLSGYCRYEQGKRDPQAHVIVTLARFFGVSADYLLGLSDEK